jgi:pimeloyl-ACP methyl ester carboxylesterase
MGGKVAMQFACTYPSFVSKLIIADIGPKYYAPHHQTILAGLQAVDFSTNPSRSEIDDTVSRHITDFGTRQFLLKSLFWKTKTQLAFRFNLEGLVNNINEIGIALPNEFIYQDTALFIRGGNSKYILDTDFESIKKQFPNATFETIPNAGHWLHAENPKLFYQLVINFVS